MTPTWRAYAKYLAKNYTAATMPDLDRRFLRVPRAFDLTDVTDLCEEVWRELFKGGSNPGSEMFDLGERCAVPCEHMWLEFTHDAFLVETCNHADSGIFSVSALVAEDGVCRLVPYARIEKADELFEVGPSAECPDDDVLLGWQAAGWVLGALAVLNSPRARASTDQVRKLLGRKYPERGGAELRVTRINIDVGGRHVSPSGIIRTASPKAYHFVRSHVRHFADGTHTEVRAHWRGDPAYGIRVGVYSARGRRPNELVH